LKLLLDINVVLDVLLLRDPWFQEAVRLLSAVEMGQAEAHVAAHTITTIHYIVARERGRGVAARAVTDVLRIVGVVPVGSADFQQALVLGISDFEDAVQAAAALQIGADYLVTRNTKDFRAAPIEARTPGEVLAML
jgi:predicted nucleic acid-binding protein